MIHLRLLVVSLLMLGRGVAVAAGPDAVAAYDRGDYAQAYPLLLRDAQGGDKVGAYLLARMLLAGEGATRDQAAGMKWLRVAAEGGEPNAQLQLGVRYERGIGVPQSSEEAYPWYRRAAEQGSVAAQLYVGILLAAGRGVPADLMQAHFWLNLATSSLPPGGIRNSAAKLRDAVTDQLSPAELAAVQQRARDWRPTPAK